MAGPGVDDEELGVLHDDEHDPQANIVLKKSSSRDYSRVMCETLTYSSEQQRGLSNKVLNGGEPVMDRQGSTRSTRCVAAAPKRNYFGHHLLGCFPGSRSTKTRSSLGLIPKLVLADHPGHGATAVAEMMMVASGGGSGGVGSSMRCGSSKGGPTFSRVPADAARGSYSEPTSPQVTCIGQVKVRSSTSSLSSSKKKKKQQQGKHKSSSHGAPSQQSCWASSSSSNYSSGNGGAVLMRSRSKRSSVSSPLASPARLARSHSSRRGGQLFEAAVRAVQESVVTKMDQDPDTSYEIDLTGYDHTISGGALVDVDEEQPSDLNVRDHIDGEEGEQDQNDDGAEELEISAKEEAEGEEESRSNSPTRGSRSAAVTAKVDAIAQQRQLAIEVSQALNSAMDRRHVHNGGGGGPDDEDQEPDHVPGPRPQEEQQRRTAVDVCVKKAAALTLKRLDSLGKSDASPRACLWMRRSIGRPLALDLSRKNRRN